MHIDSVANFKYFYDSINKMTQTLNVKVTELFTRSVEEKTTNNYVSYNEIINLLGAIHMLSLFKWFAMAEDTIHFFSMSYAEFLAVPKLQLNFLHWLYETAQKQTGFSIAVFYRYVAPFIPAASNDRALRTMVHQTIFGEDVAHLLEEKQYFNNEQEQDAWGDYVNKMFNRDFQINDLKSATVMEITNRVIKAILETQKIKLNS